MAGERGRAPLPRSPRGQAPKPMVAGVASHGHTATERRMPPTPLLPQTARLVPFPTAPRRPPARFHVHSTSGGAGCRGGRERGSRRADT